MGNYAETLSALEQLKGQLRTIGKGEIAETRRRLHDLMADVANIEKKEFVEEATKFQSLATDVLNVEKREYSFLKIFGIENNELAHSHFLAWLLDPLQDHGLESRFIENFLKKVALKTKGLDLSSISFSNLRIEREIPSDISRLDISIRDLSGSFLCIIENKILSGEGSDQTHRLYSDFHGRSPKEVFVFLTLNERARPANSNFISLTYREILPMLEDALGSSSNSDTRFLIKSYINTLERLIMSEKFEGFSERTKLYYHYRKYIEEVTNAFNKDRELLLLSLQDQIHHRSWWDDRFWKMEKTGTEINIWKEAWSPSGREGVYLQLYLHKSKPAFSLWMYGEPSEFSTKFSPTFKRLLDMKYPEKSIDGFSKTFAKGVNKFIEKNINLSLTENDQQEILKNLDEMMKLFEKVIDQSITEFRKE